MSSSRLPHDRHSSPRTSWPPTVEPRMDNYTEQMEDVTQTDNMIDPLSAYDLSMPATVDPHMLFGGLDDQLTNDWNMTPYDINAQNIAPVSLDTASAVNMTQDHEAFSPRFLVRTPTDLAETTMPPVASSSLALQTNNLPEPARAGGRPALRLLTPTSQPDMAINFRGGCSPHTTPIIQVSDADHMFNPTPAEQPSPSPFDFRRGRASSTPRATLAQLGREYSAPEASTSVGTGLLSPDRTVATWLGDTFHPGFPTVQNIISSNANSPRDRRVQSFRGESRTRASSTPGRVLVCDHHGCDKVFATASDFNHHRRYHTPDAAKPFKCRVCGKTFLFAREVRRHHGTHLDKSQRPFPCTECTYRATRKDQLVRHMKTHTRSESGVRAMREASTPAAGSSEVFSPPTRSSLPRQAAMGVMGGEAMSRVGSGQPMETQTIAMPDFTSAAQCFSFSPAGPSTMASMPQYPPQAMAQPIDLSLWNFPNVGVDNMRADSVMGSAPPTMQGEYEEILANMFLQQQQQHQQEDSNNQQHFGGWSGM